MASISRCRNFRICLVATSLFILAPIATAGSGFIQSARVTLDESSGDRVASIEVRFNCKTQYLRHEPNSGSDRLRIYLDPTTICNGVSPLVAQSRNRLRPFNADDARLLELEYDGESSAESVLTFTFSEAANFDIEMSSVSFNLTVQVRPTAEPVEHSERGPTINHRQVRVPSTDSIHWAIELASFPRTPTIADAPELRPGTDKQLYYREVRINGTPWYQLKIGYFDSADSAEQFLDELTTSYPAARVGPVESGSQAVVLTDPESTVEVAITKVDTLMEDARKSIISGDTSRAIQIYTKVLRLPENPRQAQAQELLALARERNGQTAHAKAEYQRFLALFPDHEGAARVRQRLAALLASGKRSNAPVATSGTQAIRRERRQNDWRLLTYFSQYYRRDVNQQNDGDEIVSQSALYSDMNFDARRRGTRFDFSSRISAGYRSDFLEENAGSGNALRVSYAYADFADTQTGLRGRIGRQSRNNGGVLGRFDGANVAYQLSERILLNGVVGMPAYSSSSGIDSERSFYGTSINYGPLFDGLELGLFFITQDIKGVKDRQAIGGEFRYFGETQSLWGLVDYDTSYKELGSAFLQGSWRFGSRLTFHGSFDRRHSPFLSTGNALIGQPVATFSELLELYPASEIRQFSRDRSPLSTTYSLGVSHTLTPRWHINADVNQTTLDATPESGGVAATSSSSYRYFATSLVASSLLKEGDVTIMGIRYSDSDTSQVVSLTLDSRYPLGRTWRINPRLRIDQRRRLAISSSQWIYTPGIRVHYRRSQKFRIEFQAGRQFVRQDNADTNLDRESYFVNLGYQAFF